MAKNDITVKLSKARVIGSAGFGVPLIIQGKANAAKDYAEYDSLDAVLEAGFTSDTPVYKQCAKLFIHRKTVRTRLRFVWVLEKLRKP